MEALLTQRGVNDARSMYSAELLEAGFFPLIGAPDPAEMAYEIGVWTAGLESVLNRYNMFTEKGRTNDAANDWTKEFRMTQSALGLCSKLNFRLRKALTVPGAPTIAVSVEDSDQYAAELRDVITLNNNFTQNGQAAFDEWKTWSSLLSSKIRTSPAARRFIAHANNFDTDLLPEALRQLLYQKQMPFADQADLHLILTGFARVLKSLAIVGRMLRNDEPLKHTLLIFARIYDQTNDLISYIDNRLARFPDEEADFFNSLDSASYTASLELKKVYKQELNGLVAMRPAPSIFAKVETAYALLNDSFQQIIAGFARFIDADADVEKLFPNFRVKLEQSLVLRGQLWRVLQVVQAAEQQPDGQNLGKLKLELNEFIDGPIRFLFYKDKETLERFNEEIRSTSDEKDLISILHRFGAYLETLFGQINMRSVLIDHPFEGRT